MTTTPGDDSRPLPGLLLTGLALALVVEQYLFWAPNYLTWPYWPDHDVFANAAQSWDAGLLPYRDVRLNQTPGTLYLFWLLGKAFGWGQPAGFFGLDAALIGIVLATMLAWSRVRFGRLGPGLVGALALEAVLFNLDYAHAAQRDGQAPILAVLALLILQVGPRSMVGLVASAAVVAFALAIRPQVVLLIPALIASVGWLDPDRPIRASLGRSAAWLALLGGFGLLLLLPLYRAGILGDFVASLRVVAPGSGYNRAGASEVFRRWTDQAGSTRWIWIVVVTLVLLVRGRPAADRRLTLAWLLALAGVSLWLPLSPLLHIYLEIPLALVAASSVPVAVAWAGDPRAGSISLRRILVYSLAIAAIPSVRGEFVRFRPSIEVLTAWLRPGESGRGRILAPSPDRRPPGYRPGRIRIIGYYPWADYAALVDYLRRETAPTTRVANMLKGELAVAGMVGRISAFPAEAVTWLRIVHRDETAAFARRLEAETDSVVVWGPNEPEVDAKFPEHFEELEAVVRRLYRPAARFGDIEVWRRADPAATPAAP